MKKLLIGIFFTLCILAGETVFAAIPGDIDGNSKIELADAIMALQAVAGIRDIAGADLSDAIAALRVLAGLASGTSTATLKIPDTGQTKCYDSEGIEINCSGTGQDGEFSINPMSYTRLADGTVRDNVTGLIWEVKENADSKPDYSNPNDADNEYTWYYPDQVFPGKESDNDTQDFLQALKSKTGHNDWRLPTREELHSIVDYSLGSFSGKPTIDENYFPNTKQFNYWSSSTCAFYTNQAWCVYFYYGGYFYQSMVGEHYVRAVRSGQSRSFDSLIIGSGSKTITDRQTGLMWEMKENMDSKPVIANLHDADNYYKWQEVLSWVAQLNAEKFGGYSDWRLPTIKELASLADLSKYDPALPDLLKNTTKSGWHWSSTTYINSKTGMWCFNFRSGDILNFDKIYTNHYVRAVRSIQ